MPGMPIFQDSPSQLKGQIYVQDSVTSNLVPLEVDASGNLPVSGSVTLATGATIDTVTTVGTITNDVGVVNGATPLDIDTVSTVTAVTAITNDVGVVNGATPLNVGTVSTVTAVTAITNDVGVINGATPLDIDTVSTVTAVTAITNDVGVINGATPLDVGLSAGTNLIGKVENQLVFTNLDAFGAATLLDPQAVGAGPATVTATSRNISLESSYNWFIKNQGTGVTQDITLVVEISPDGTNWLEDTGTIISVAFGESKMITVTNFLQFARFVITGGTAATTVISSFQAQH